MTTGAGDGGMSSRQRERRGVVVECGGSPCRGIVAYGTVLREARGHVIGISRVVVILKMTADAGSGGSGEHSSNLTLRAIQMGMRAEQSKSGDTRVIKACKPVVGTVARLAPGRVA